MTARTAPTAITVVKAEISISSRILAASRTASGSSGSSGRDNEVLMTVSQGSSEEVVIAGEEAGERLDRVLAARIEALSRSRLKALILDGAVAIGGRTIRDPGYRVKSGETAIVMIPPAEPAEPLGEDIPLK